MRLKPIPHRRRLWAAATLLAAALPAFGVAAPTQVGWVAPWTTLPTGSVKVETPGGLVLQSEELLISLDRIRVALVFSNPTDADIRSTVSFQVPPFSTQDPWSDEPESRPRGSQPFDPTAANPMGFKLAVEGKPWPFASTFRRERGAVRLSHHWEQRFPKGQSVSIEHEYIPIAGRYFSSDAARPSWQALARRYCIGPKLLAWMQAREREIAEVHFKSDGWNGSIGQFRLTLRKDSADGKLSLCLPDTPRTVSPTAFVVERKNFSPSQDLRVLFVSPWE